MPENHDDKYITFKRDEFFKLLGEWTQYMKDDTNSMELVRDVDTFEIPDAVVIRRQDFFAAPALAGYAASIALTVKLTDDDARRSALMGIADYFEQQAQLAAEEGFKFPDL